jgi:hypothetical protein
LAELLGLDGYGTPGIPDTGTGNIFLEYRILLTVSCFSARLISKLEMAKTPHSKKLNGFMELPQKI